jgi:hypothetical protein
VVIPTLLLSIFYVLFHTENRYNHTIMPLVTIAAASGLFQLAEYLSARRAAGEVAAGQPMVK